MKKSIRIFLASALALPATAFAQSVQIDFVVNAQGVPLSPWLTGLIALILAFAGIAFLRRRGGLGMFIAAFAVVLAGISVSQVTDANGIPIALDVSPKIVPFSCPNPPLIFQSGGQSGGVTITGVTITGTPPVVPASKVSVPSLPAPSPTCAVGTRLTGSDTCEVDPCIPG